MYKYIRSAFVHAIRALVLWLMGEFYVWGHTFHIHSPIEKRALLRHIAGMDALRIVDAKARAFVSIAQLMTTTII